MKVSKNKNSINRAITRDKVTHVVSFEGANGQPVGRAFASRVQAVKWASREKVFHFILTAQKFAKWIGDFDVAPDGLVIL